MASLFLIFFIFCFIFHYSACLLELHQIRPSDMYLNMYVYIPHAKIPFSFRSEYIRQHFVLSSRIQFALYLWCIFADMPIFVATRSKTYVCGRSLAGNCGFEFRRGWLSASCDCCVLSGRALCFRLITRPEVSY